MCAYVNEARPFRFGAGPRVSSKYSIVIPLNLDGASSIPWLRISVVDQDVPLLLTLSKGALKGLGACLDLGAAKMGFSKLGTSLDLVETSTGLCGFMINEKRNHDLYQSELRAMLDGELEVTTTSGGDASALDEDGDALVHASPE